jgi:hypothetical protein
MTTDYTNVALGDVVGWAPTSDTFAYNFNYCDGGNQFLPPANGTIKPSGGDGNTAAIKRASSTENTTRSIFTPTSCTT